MTQLIYYVAPWDRETKQEQPAWTPAPDDVHTLRHGYNLADLDRLARRALWRVWGVTTDYQARYDLAWSAIAEALYTAPDDQPPQPADLVFAGQDAIARHVRAEMHHHGHDKRNGGAPMRLFAVYWETPWRNANSPEPGVVDRTALWQIWPELTDRQRQAFLALAAHGTYEAAAQSLSVTYNTFKRHIEEGRRRFLALWHEGETPSRVWGSDRRVARMGGAKTDVSYRSVANGIRRGRRPRASRKIEPVHGKVTTYNNHKCRCPACVEAKRIEGVERRAQAGVAKRKQMTVSQFADAVRRNQAGETWTAIAASLGFSDSYLRALRRGAAAPIPDLPSDGVAGHGSHGATHTADLAEKAGIHVERWTE